MSTPKHGALADPTGIVLTGALLHEKRTKVEDKAFECNDNAGMFACGKSLSLKTTVSVNGEGLSTLSLPTVGTGAATAASPHIDDSEINDKSEGAAEFSLTAHYYGAGGGNFPAS